MKLCLCEQTSLLLEIADLELEDEAKFRTRQEARWLTTSNIDLEATSPKGFSWPTQTLLMDLMEVVLCMFQSPAAAESSANMPLHLL